MPHASMTNWTSVLTFDAQSTTDTTLEQLTAVLLKKIINHTRTRNSATLMSTLSARTTIIVVSSTPTVLLNATIAS